MFWADLPAKRSAPALLFLLIVTIFTGTGRTALWKGLWLAFVIP